MFTTEMVLYIVSWVFTVFFCWRACRHWNITSKKEHTKTELLDAFTAIMVSIILLSFQIVFAVNWLYQHKTIFTGG